MIVLAFDTALAACSVALYDTGREQILAARFHAMARGHAEALPGMIAAAMAESGLEMTAIDRILVTRGPGTFTGVRIGLATARGLALALRRPACGITTLEALAAGVTPAADTVCLASVIDARRGEVYVQVFAADGSAADEARLVSVETAVRQIPPEAMLVGTGAAVVIAAGCHRQLALAPSLPDAGLFVRRGASVSPAAPSAEPLYLRAPDAKPQARDITKADAAMSVVDAGPVEAAILAGLHAAAFARAWSADEFAVLLASPAVIALLAAVGEDRPQPAGFVLARRAADDAEILTICTRPAARRLGGASQLMAALMDRLEQQGVSSLFLEVDAGNSPALGLYEKLGFVEVGRRSSYYQASEDGGGDAVVMRRRLQAG